MNTFPLEFREGHVFTEFDDGLWLLDTGAPTSFGLYPLISIAGEQFSIDGSYLGLSAETLSEYIGTACAGLLGTDILGRFDHIIDIEGGKLTASTSELSYSGRSVCLDDFMGIPIVTVQIQDSEYRMFLDTGAQISYYQGDSFANFRNSGTVTDFYPGFGQFQTDTYEIPISLGGVKFTLRCCILPDLLAATLIVARVDGIVGNEILLNRVVGYFPRRKELVI